MLPTVAEAGHDGAVRVGVIGAGNVLPAYLAVLDRLATSGYAELGPICARRAESRASVIRRRPGSTVVERPEDVLAPPVDAVVVLTPPDSHAELVGAALAAGKHVLCEKPLALDRATAASLYDAAAAVGRHLVSAPFVHLSPTFEAVHRLVAAGAIGPLHSARGFYGNAGPDWASWYYRLGPTGDLGIYNLKCLVVLAGPVVEVAAMATTGRSRRTVAGTDLDVRDDTVHLLLRHASGTVSSVGSSLAVERYRRVGLELYGSAGTINVLGDDWSPRGHELWREASRRWELFEPPDETWSWADGLRDLVHAIRDDRAPRADPTIDLHLLDVLQAADEAARTGSVQSVSSTVVGLGPTAEADVTHMTHDRTRPLEDQ
jgi:predicted dehydrogenase